MPPKQYVQKPYKVIAEQYQPGTTPLPADATTREGLCVCTTYPPVGAFADGRPHVHTATQTHELLAGEWIVQEQWSPHAWFVIPDAEFQDRF